MERGIFVDTGGWIALLYRHDQFHDQAKSIYKQFARVRKVTTEAVLIETCNFLSKLPLRPLAVTFKELVAQAEALRVLRIVPVDRTLLLKGWELFAQRPDKEWSLTDCISFVVMKEQGLYLAFTTDHNFEQAGFEILLKRS